ncbi:MAG: N-acetylmuramic acid 6-phosphate etherase [Jatrophihabitans sp.]|uniref:N-acetylmuramic acid 6-phosphate etherase n=1 Tax=Jatrophihabitans sp. TaxID=1932789 RepID=UPI003911397F
MSGDRPELDRLPTAEVVDLLLDAEARVAPALRRAAPALSRAAELLADTISSGGRIVFSGAGTSGRLAAAEAAELPGTFGVAEERCLALVAGGGTAPIEAAPINDAAEDDADGGAAGVRALGLTTRDVLVAVAASGRTPYTVAAATEALAAGATVIAIVTAAATPLGRLATAAVQVTVGDEVLRGSTRLTAGTAQKVALNTLTTAAMARAGRVHGDLMIDVVAGNAKLRERAMGIVAEIAGRSPADAAAALAACDDDARAAVLHLVHDLSPEIAKAAAATAPSLRHALRNGSER